LVRRVIAHVSPARRRACCCAARYVYDQIAYVSLPTAFVVFICSGAVALSIEEKIKSIQVMKRNGTE
jgi:hypothetical protein